MKNVIDIVFDGSFLHKDLTIGIGALRPGNLSVDTPVMSQTLNRGLKKQSSSILEQKGAILSEMLAAKMALDSVEEPSRINIYGDCKEVIDILNGWGSEKTRQTLRPALKCLASAVSRHTSVRAFHTASRAASHLSPAAIGIAHNASALASGSLKIERTAGYDGPYSHRAILFQGYSQRSFNCLLREGMIPKPDRLTIKRIEAFTNMHRSSRPSDRKAWKQALETA